MAMTEKEAEGCSSCVILLILWFIGAFCLEYVVEFWASYYKGTEVDFSFFVCFFCALFVGRYSIALAIFTFIASYFVSV